MGFMSALTVILPSECGEKVSLAITILLSQILELLVLSDILPPSGEGDFPLSGMYVIFQIILISLSVVECVVVTKIYFTPCEKGIPIWLKSFVRSKYVHVLVRFNSMSRETKDGGKIEPGNDSGFEMTQPNHSVARSLNSSKSDISNSSKSDISKHMQLLDSQLASLASYDVNISHGSQEWKIVSIFIDRVFLIFYIAFLLIGFFTFLFSMVMQIWGAD